MTTREKLLQHQDALRQEFGPKETIAFFDVTHTQLSISRYYGGCTVGNHRFIYNPTDDSLIRSDVLAFIGKLEKAAKKAAKAERKRKKQAEPSLLDVGETEA